MGGLRMKKSVLKERIAELEKDVALLQRSLVLERERVEQWRKTAGETHTELVKWMAAGRAVAGAEERDTKRRDEDENLYRIKVLEQDVAEIDGRLDKLEQPQSAPRKHFAAEDGQPSVTVTATQALAAAEHDMAGKLRELLLGGAEAMGGRQALYLNGLTLGLHPTVAMDRARMGAEAWHAKELAEHAASLKQSGIFKETIVQPPIRFYPDNLEEFRVGVGTANAINKWFKDPPLDQNPPDNILNFLQSIVDKVTWCGKVGKVEGLDGEFRYSEGETAFRISYQCVSLGLYELVDGHWFRATKG